MFTTLNNKVVAEEVVVEVVVSLVVVVVVVVELEELDPRDADEVVVSLVVVLVSTYDGQSSTRADPRFSTVRSLSWGAKLMLSPGSK